MVAIPAVTKTPTQHPSINNFKLSGAKWDS